MRRSAGIILLVTTLLTCGRAWADTRSACIAACEGEARCRAWTYMRPGYQGPAARCYLKDRLRPPRRKPCCVSGVVR